MSVSSRNLHGTGTGESPGPCPDAAELAAFSEGRLEPERSEDVARHVLTCGECKDVIAAIAGHLEQGAVLEPRRTYVPWAIAAGVVVAVAAGWWIGANRWRAGESGNAGIAELVRATGERRFSEGRLSGGFKWGPVTNVRGLPPAADRWAIAGAAARIRGDSEDTSQEADAHALGVAHLLLGSTDDAIRQLERAAEDAPAEPTVLSDLAAALIERGRAPDNAQDLVRALDAAERALTVAPDLPEARFNKALAIEELGLREAAIRAWDDYLKVDASSPWANEARSRVERLRAVPKSRTWKEDAPAFARACATKDVTRVEAIVRAHPQEAFESSMADLGKWADLAIANDPGAAAMLRRVALGASALTSVTGDPLVEIAVREIEDAAAHHAETNRLARAHQMLRDGRADLDDARAEDGFRLLTEATQRFTASASVCRSLALLYRFSSAYYLGHGAENLPALSAFGASFRGHRPQVAGCRAWWLEGLVLGVSGRADEAAARLSEARAGFESLGFTADAVFVRSIESAAWWELGQTRRAWDGQRAVFRQLDAVTDPRRAQGLVSNAASNAEAEGNRSAALALQQAALSFSSRIDTAMDRCDGLVWLASAAARAGRLSLASKAAMDARADLDRVVDDGFRARLDAELSLVEAGLSLGQDPLRAAALADRSVRWFESVRKENQLVDAYHLRARARDRAGNADGASKDFLLALESAERQRDHLDDVTLRTTFFDSAWDLSRDIVRFELDRGDPRGALELADRIRSTSIGRPAEPTTTPPRATVEVLLGQLQRDQAIVFFSVLEDRIVTWILRRGDLHVTVIPVPERELDRTIQAWRRAVAEGKIVAGKGASARLFERIIAPLGPQLAGAVRIVIVPDGPLYGIPWSALYDASAGHVWAEDVAVAVAPSLRPLVGPPGKSTNASQYRVLVVGDPEFDRREHPDLPALPGAASEARRIASLYARATVLVGAAATPDRVLAELDHVQVVHVAAHAVPDGIDPDRSALVLAPASSFNSRGDLTAREVRGRELHELRLLVLAACRSGDGPPSRILGPMSLARPFLDGGARAVVVTLWDLPDAAGAVVMQALHRHVSRGEQPMQALRGAVRECWAMPDPDPRACGGVQLIVNESIGG